MAYRYKLRYISKTSAEIATALGGMRCTGMTYFASFRTPEKECGRPLGNLRKPRWFEEGRDPNQLWLPFKEFIPVRVQRISQQGCEFAVDGSYYRAGLKTNSHRLKRNTLQALEVYERIWEEPQAPCMGVREAAYAFRLISNIMDCSGNFT